MENIDFEKLRPASATHSAGKRQTVVYVAGLGGSGSTMLGILLARMGKTVSLGEIFATLKTPLINGNSVNRCACGEKVLQCEFWGEVRAADPARLSRQQAYALVLERFRKQYPGMVMVDTSKSLRELMKGWLSGAFDGQIDLRIIHIVRDYRGWALTQERKHHQRDKFFARKKPIILHCLTWWLRNLAWQRFLKKSGLPTLTLSYESLVFNREREMQRIADFAGLAGADDATQEQGMRLHDCHGNQLRLNPQMYAKLRYDYRWMLDQRFIWLSLLLLPAHNYWKSVNYRDQGKPPDTLKANFTTSLR